MIAALYPKSTTILQRLEADIPEETLFIATDGGVQSQAGSGWIMASSDKAIYASGHSPVHGRDITSYRAELFGLLAAITMLNEAMRKHKQAPKTILLYCDNKVAVDIANDIQKSSKTTFARRGGL